MVICNRPVDGDLAGAAVRDALRHELASVDEQPRACALAQAVLTQVTDLFAKHRELCRVVVRATGFVLDDFGFDVTWRVVELERNETLARAVLKVLERALITGVVGENQEETICRFEEFPALFDWEYAPVVGQRVNEDGSVLARLDNFVQVANSTGLDRSGKWAIDPNCGIAFKQVAANEVACCEVFVAGDCYQRQGLAFWPLDAPAV